jgi:glucose-1-phosphate thymidylyltransferase
MTSVLIIPAGGRATRLSPITNTVSKAMVPILGKPIIRYILDEYKECFDKIVVVHGVLDDLPNFLRSNYEDVILVEQDDPRGPLHAIHLGLQAVDYVDNVTVWLGDTIVTGYKPRLFLSRNLIAVKEVPDYERWCLYDPVSRVLIDKPKTRPDTNLALIGIYHFANFIDTKQKVADIIKSEVTFGGEFQISQILNCYLNTLEYITVNDWYDCGDVASLYESSGRLLTKNCRSDNMITYDAQSCTLRKEGTRVANEANWYKKIPSSTKPYVPAIYKIMSEYSDVPFYEMEQCSGVMLDSLFVYDNLPESTVEYILKKVVDNYFKAFPIDTDQDAEKCSITNMLITKNVLRVMEYSYDFVSTDDVVLFCKTALSYKSLPQLSLRSEVIHGDYHLGNLIFDPTTGKIKALDPRGEWDGKMTTSGSFTYDMVKLYQSVYGSYMWIYHDAVVDGAKRAMMCKILDDILFKIDFAYLIPQIRRYVPILMGSALPFHNDNPKRQQQMWETSMKLIKGTA